MTLLSSQTSSLAAPSGSVSPEKPEQRMLEKRAKVVAELVQTEKDYIRDLETCIERVMVPLQQAQVGDRRQPDSVDLQACGAGRGQAVTSTAVPRLQTEWLSGEGIKAQRKGGQTFRGTQFQGLACGWPALLLLSKASWQGLGSSCSSWRPGSRVSRGGASAPSSVT